MVNFLSYFPDFSKINYVQGLVILVVGILVVKIFTALLRGFLKAADLNKSLVGIFSSVGEAIFWFFLLLITISAFGFGEAARILSFVGGAFALAAGLGAQSMVANLLAGFNLASDKDFEIGYKIQFEEISGIVEFMDHRKVRIVDESGEVYVIPNKKVEEGMWKVINRGKEK